MLLITRNFGSVVFGRYTLTVTFSQIVVLIFTLGFPNGIIRLLTDPYHYNIKPKSNFLNKVFWITLILSVLISILLYINSNFIALYLFNDESLIEYIKILSFFITPLMFHEILLNIYRGKKDFKKYNLFLFVLPPLLFIIIYFLFFNKSHNETSVILSFLFSILSVLILEIIFSRKIRSSNQSNYPIKQLLKLSLPMMLSGTILFLLSWTDIFMIGIMTSSKDVGIYSAAFKVASIGLIIILVFNVVIGPKVSELYNNNYMSKLKTTINKTTQLITFLTIPIFSIIIIFRKEILSFFGNDFIQGESVLIILSTSVLINAISGNVDQILNMTNHQKIMKNITLFCLIENIILNYILIPIYGINGAAWSSLITTASLNFISIYYIKKKLGFFTFI